MNASVAIQSLPQAANDEELIRIVDEVIAYIKSTGLNYYVGPFETRIEGDYDELMDIVKECQHIAVRAGAPSVAAYIKVTYKPEGEVLTIEKKLQNITNSLHSAAAIILILAAWQILSGAGVVPSFLLPSPAGVVRAFIKDFPLLMAHTKVTLMEAALGLSIGIGTGFVFAVLMDCFQSFYKAFYPIIVITQTIPTIAIAPLLVLWLGYDMAPKVTLIVIVTFFPVAVGLLEGFRAADADTMNLLKAMGANKMQIFRHVKLPGAMDRFFASLKISASYSVVGAVIAEWLGGYNGLGVYMTRVRKSYAFDKMFAVIFLISAVSLLLMYGVEYLQKKLMPWKTEE